MIIIDKYIFWIHSIFQTIGWVILQHESPWGTKATTAPTTWVIQLSRMVHFRIESAQMFYSWSCFWWRLEAMAGQMHTQLSMASRGNFSLRLMETVDFAVMERPKAFLSYTTSFGTTHQCQGLSASTSALLRLAAPSIANQPRTSLQPQFARRNTPRPVEVT